MLGRKFTQAHKCVCSWKPRCWCTNRSKQKDWRPWTCIYTKFFTHDWINSGLSQSLQVIIMNYYNVHNRNHDLFKYFMEYIQNKKPSHVKKQLWFFISSRKRRNIKIKQSILYYLYLFPQNVRIVCCEMYFASSDNFYFITGNCWSSKYSRSIKS